MIIWAYSLLDYEFWPRKGEALYTSEVEVKFFTTILKVQEKFLGKILCWGGGHRKAIKLSHEGHWGIGRGHGLRIIWRMQPFK